MPLRSPSSRRRSSHGKLAAVLGLAALVLSPAATSAAHTADAGDLPLPTEPALRAATLLAADTPGTEYFSPELVESLGYQPVIVGGIAERADGDCSSPVALPAGFDDPCKTHDLGYDLLRVAHDDGQRIPPGLRHALDLQLERRMHASCTAAEADPDDLAGCHLAATAAAAAVDANTIRQGDGTPVHEGFPDIVRSFAGSERGGL